MNRILLVFVAIGPLLIVSCGGGGGPANTNAGSNANAPVNSNAVQTVDPANRPPGLSGSPVEIGPNIPGIPVNPQPLQKGPTPIPGIPSEAELKKKTKPGATPTPGIPDEATIRKAMGQPPRNANVKP